MIALYGEQWGEERMDSTNDRQRKDRLIQTRVPQNLESTLKDEARKRRLSVSHLIRNVLEDTFNLVDNVVHEVDRVVADSVGMAQTLRRDAQRLAATARGQTLHRERAGKPVVDSDGVEVASDTPEPVQGVQAASEELPSEPGDLVSAPDGSQAADGSPIEEELPEESHRAGQPHRGLSEGSLAKVYGFQELVLNRPAECASCGVSIARGSRAFLGMTDDPGPRVWVCQDCVDSLSG